MPLKHHKTEYIPMLYSPEHERMNFADKPCLKSPEKGYLAKCVNKMTKRLIVQGASNTASPSDFFPLYK